MACAAPFPQIESDGWTSLVAGGEGAPSLRSGLPPRSNDCGDPCSQNCSAILHGVVDVMTPMRAYMAQLGALKSATVHLDSPHSRIGDPTTNMECVTSAHIPTSAKKC